jgi:hypothetical protein
MAFFFAVYLNCIKRTLKENFAGSQGGWSGLSPLRSDGSWDGQTRGWTSGEVAEDAQGRVGKQL